MVNTIADQTIDGKVLKKKRAAKIWTERIGFGMNMMKHRIRLQRSIPVAEIEKPQANLDRQKAQSYAEQDRQQRKGGTLLFQNFAINCLILFGVSL